MSKDSGENGKGNESPGPKKGKGADDPRLPDKSLFRVDEVADYFRITERCVHLWIEHGHLKAEKIVGSVRVPRESILRCRFRKMASDPQI